MFPLIDQYCLGRHMFRQEFLLPVVLHWKLQYLSTKKGYQVMGKILHSSGTFSSLLQRGVFFCEFQCTAVGLLLSDKDSTWFPEFTFDLFDTSSQSAIFFSSLHITYMRGCWAFNCIFGGIGEIGMVFSAQWLSMFLFNCPSWVLWSDSCYIFCLIDVYILHLEIAFVSGWVFDRCNNVCHIKSLKTPTFLLSSSIYYIPVAISNDLLFLFCIFLCCMNKAGNQNF